MTALNYLIFANIAFWLGLGLYFLFIAKKQHNLDKRLKNMENMHE